MGDFTKNMSQVNTGRDKKSHRQDKREGKAEFGGGAAEELYVCLGKEQWGFTEPRSSKIIMKVLN